jgi:hypothetical protein
MASVLGLSGIPRTNPPPRGTSNGQGFPPLAYIESGASPVAPLFRCRQLRRNVALKLAFQGMDSKRGSPRQRVLKGGKIVFAGGSFSVDCTIRNLSETGARLQIPTTGPIPDRFHLGGCSWWHASRDQNGVRFDPPKT